MKDFLFNTIVAIVGIQISVLFGLTENTSNYFIWQVLVGIMTIAFVRGIILPLLMKL